MGYYLLFSLAFFMPASFAPYQKKSLASFSSPFSKLFQLQNRMHSFWIEGVLYSHVGNWIIPFWPLFWWKMGHFSRCSRCASGASKAAERYFYTEPFWSCLNKRWRLLLSFVCVRPTSFSFLQGPLSRPRNGSRNENDLNYRKSPRGGDAHVNYTSLRRLKCLRKTLANQLCYERLRDLQNQLSGQNSPGLEFSWFLLVFVLLGGQCHCRAQPDDSSVSFNPGISAAKPMVETKMLSGAASVCVHTICHQGKLL